MGVLTVGKKSFSTVRLSNKGEITTDFLFSINDNVVRISINFCSFGRMYSHAAVHIGAETTVSLSSAILET